jgi:hypothetical protein
MTAPKLRVFSVAAAFGEPGNPDGWLMVSHWVAEKPEIASAQAVQRFVIEKNIRLQVMNVTVGEITEEALRAWVKMLDDRAMQEKTEGLRVVPMERPNEPAE